MPDGYSFNLADYCSHCPDFDAKTNFITPSPYNETEKLTTVISCKKAQRCENMIKYFLNNKIKEMEKRNGKL